MKGRAVTYLAVDLGAESGRVVAGAFDGSRITFDELARFPNVPVRLPGGLHWDPLRWLAETTAAVARCIRSGVELESLGIDSWAADFDLLDGRGELLGIPFHYRDDRTVGMFGRAFARVSPNRIWAATGNHFLAFNTLYQLLALEGTPQIDSAETMLLIPDLLDYWLTGEIGCEYTNASTTQLLDVHTLEWAWGSLKRCGCQTDYYPSCGRRERLLVHCFQESATSYPGDARHRSCAWQATTQLQQLWPLRSRGWMRPTFRAVPGRSSVSNSTLRFSTRLRSRLTSQTRPGSAAGLDSCGTLWVMGTPGVPARLGTTRRRVRIRGARSHGQDAGVGARSSTHRSGNLGSASSGDMPSRIANLCAASGQ